MERAYHRSIRWSFIGSAGLTLLQFLQMLVFARLAGPAAAGDYALAAAFMGFLTPLAEAGLSQAVVQAEAVDPRQLATLAWLNLAVAVLALGVVTWVSPWIAGWYGRPDLAGLLPLMGLALLAMPFGASPAGMLVRAFRFAAVARIEMAAATAGFLVLAVLAACGWGAWAMATGFLVRQTALALANLWAMQAHTKIDWWRPASLRSVGTLVRFGSYDLAARWADFLANYLDKLIVGKWLGATALGYYQLAFSLLVLPTARLGYLFTRVSYPVFARLRGSALAMEAFFQRTAMDLTGLLYPVYLGMLLFAGEIIRVLYGPAWLPAVPLLQAFAIAGWVRTLNAVFPPLTKGIGHPQWLFGWMLLWTLLSNGTLTVFLAFNPTAGTAAWSRVAAKFLLEIPLLAMLAGRCNVGFGPVIGHAAMRLAWLMPVAVAVGLADWIIDDFWCGFALKTAVFLLCLIGLGWGSPFRSDWQRLMLILAPAADK